MTSDAGSDASTGSGDVTPPAQDLGADAGSIEDQIAAVDVTKLGVTSTDDPKFKMLGLFQKLAVAKAFQPANALKSTTVYDAVGKELASPVVRVHQVAGWPVDASYCDRGETNLGLDVMVCEFRDDASAIKSRAAILNEMKKKPQSGRELIALKGSWVSVTVFGAKPKPEQLDQQKKILALVKNL